jgi:hypothetical protein
MVHDRQRGPEEALELDFLQLQKTAEGKAVTHVAAVFTVPVLAVISDRQDACAFGAADCRDFPVLGAIPHDDSPHASPHSSLGEALAKAFFSRSVPPPFVGSKVPREEARMSLWASLGKKPGGRERAD